jgi:hypothetical protein
MPLPRNSACQAAVQPYPVWMATALLLGLTIIKEVSDGNTLAAVLRPYSWPGGKPGVTYLWPSPTPLPFHAADLPLLQESVFQHLCWSRPPRFSDGNTLAAAKQNILDDTISNLEALHPCHFCLKIYLPFFLLPACISPWAKRMFLGKASSAQHGFALHSRDRYWDTSRVEHILV